MEIREISSEDHPRLMELHEKMALGYPLDLADPNMVIKMGLFNGSPAPIAAILGRATSEAYLLLDCAWGTPERRWEAVLRVVAAAHAQAKLLGFSDVHVWLPPKIEKTFARRLKKLGFMQAPWTCYTAKL
jgi:hypothetical protein